METLAQARARFASPETSQEGGKEALSGDIDSSPLYPKGTIKEVLVKFAFKDNALKSLRNTAKDMKAFQRQRAMTKYFKDRGIY